MMSPYSIPFGGQIGPAKSVLQRDHQALGSRHASHTPTVMDGATSIISTGHRQGNVLSVAEFPSGPRRPSVDCLCHDAPCPLRRDKLRPAAVSSGSRGLDEIRCKLSTSIRCLSKMRRVPSSASSSDSAISEPWPVSSAYLTITRWRTIWIFNSAMCPLAWARCS
jgi:hypothetical protein